MNDKLRQSSRNSEQRMTHTESKLVDIFMEAQAKPEGRIFSENILAGIKAVLAFTDNLAVIKTSQPDNGKVINGVGVDPLLLRRARWALEGIDPDLTPITHAEYASLLSDLEAAVEMSAPSEKVAWKETRTLVDNDTRIYHMPAGVFIVLPGPRYMRLELPKLPTTEAPDGKDALEAAVRWRDRGDGL